MQKETQEQQVINALEKEGGLATLRRLNEIVDFSAWQTKTPEASVRRIVQNSKEIFKVQPGLWALECQKESILNKLNLKIGDKRSEELFSHSYYQGLIAGNRQAKSEQNIHTRPRQKQAISWYVIGGHSGHHHNSPIHLRESFKESKDCRCHLVQCP